MNTEKMFREAIEIAKAVREAAVLNAKDQLEEQLTPQIKQLLAEKLAKLNEEGEEEVEDELTPELPPVDGSEESELDGEEGLEGEEELDLEDMTLDDLKDVIRDVLAQVQGEEEEGQELSADMEDGEYPEEEEGEDLEGDEDQEIDLDELLAELEGELGEGFDTADAAARGVDNIRKGANNAWKNRKQIGKRVSDTMKDLGRGAGYALRREEVDSEMEEGFDTADAAARGVDNIRKGVKKAYDNRGKIGKKVSDTMKDLGKGAGYALRREEAESLQAEVVDLKKKLNESIRTINTLTKENKTVNLLNSKLLYLNKVLKAYYLTESLKADVIAAFDNAENVKEVKLVYETVISSIAANKKKSNVNESVSKAGRASKAVGGSTRPKAILTEADEQVKRFQKLAGIIK